MEQIIVNFIQNENNIIQFALLIFSFALISLGALLVFSLASSIVELLLSPTLKLASNFLDKVVKKVSEISDNYSKKVRRWAANYTRRTMPLGAIHVINNLSFGAQQLKILDKMHSLKLIMFNKFLIRFLPKQVKLAKRNLIKIQAVKTRRLWLKR